MTTNVTNVAGTSGQSKVAGAVRRTLGSAASLLALTALAAGSAVAQTADVENPSAGQTLGEVTVTGSRIVRDGYEAPTPVSVLGAEELGSMALTNVADAVNRLPAFSGSVSTRSISSNVSSGTAGVNALNLRSLGANRTLVLLDGKRMVPSSLGTGGNASAVDVNAIPNGLIQRVEVVTGGASAVYGSDALAGVVNFILDKEYVGTKVALDGGITQYGDGENYKFTLTHGASFADGRGHLLLSGEYNEDKGVIGNDRRWADQSYLMMDNPAYASDPTQPRLINVYNAGVANATTGGLILQCRDAGGVTMGNCPVYGTRFVEGGAAIPFTFGDPMSGAVMSGGDWQSSRIDRLTSLALPLQRRTFFGRVSFDLTDNVTAFAEANYSKTKSHNEQVVYNLNTGPTVRVNVAGPNPNPFIPADIAAAAAAVNVDHFMIGTLNGDLGYLQGINGRELKRVVTGLEGNFDLGATNWNWDAYYTHGEQDISSFTPGNVIKSHYRNAIDAVRDPTSGRIICRINADFLPGYNAANADPACRPYNVMGLGVNSPEVVSYVSGMGHSETTLKQDVVAASMSGEPFSTWAGPVSIAFGAEHRRESVSGWASDIDEADDFFAGNYHATHGKYNVTEGFLETVVPLASGVFMADTLDFNGAVRWTDYSTSGEVTTWKLGATWAPIQDIRFRFTKSRDIRAPNLGELFNSGQSGTGNNYDPLLGTSYLMQQRTTGNPNLQPEEADTTGIGLVLAPSFLPGFQMSIDYYNIEIDGSVATVATRRILEMCAAGDATMCSFITRDPTQGNQVSLVNISPANILGQEVAGFDVEASYSFPLPVGDLRLRALASFVDKLETIDETVVDGRGVNTTDGGIGLGTALSTPKHRFLASASYELYPATVTLTMRGVSSGVYNNAFIECQPGSCPVLPANSTTWTINDNRIDAVQYFDLALNYKAFDDRGEFYFTIENLLNEDPALIAGGRGAGFYQGQSNAANYDRFGRTFRGGVKFSF